MSRNGVGISINMCNRCPNEDRLIQVNMFPRFEMGEGHIALYYEKHHGSVSRMDVAHEA